MESLKLLVRLKAQVDCSHIKYELECQKTNQDCISGPTAQVEAPSLDHESQSGEELYLCEETKHHVKQDVEEVSLLQSKEQEQAADEITQGGKWAEEEHL